MNTWCFLQNSYLEILFGKWLGWLFAWKHGIQPWNKAALGQAFEALTEKEKFDWKLEKLGWIFKALLRASFIARFILSQ